MKVYCTRPRQPHEAPHLNEIPNEGLSEPHLCATCGMPLILQGRYVPIEELGHGSFGYTFLALDLKFGQSRRALKQFRADKLLLSGEIAQAKRAFKREYEILDRLKHPQIPRIYEPFEIQTTPDLRSGVSGDRQATDYYYFVQEYIQGEDLAQSLKDGRSFTEREVRAILQQILQVLQYIHSQSPPIIHRDIKPSNIFCADDGNFHLIDFGAVKQILAEVTVESAQSEAIFVARGFSPSEQYHGIVDFSLDLYALGKTCICLLEGTSLPPSPWKPIATSDSLVSILDQMTAENPNHRYNSITEIIDELALNRTSNSSVVAPDLITVSGSTHQQLDPTQTNPKNSGWFKVGIGVGIATALLGIISQRANIFPPQPLIPIEVTKFDPPQYPYISDVRDVPDGNFESCCSKTWKPLTDTIDSIIMSLFNKLKLSPPPLSGEKLKNSDTGIQMLIDGKIAIALSSRPIELWLQPANKNIQLMETRIARISTAVVVHPQLKLKGITIKQYEHIKNGKITNWREVGGPNIKINIYMEDDSYLGKNVNFNRIYGNGKRDAVAAAFEKVAADEGGFTIAPSNLAVEQCQIKTLSIGVNPTKLVSPYRQEKGLSTSTCNQKVNIDVIENGSYPLFRDLRIFMRADNPKKVGQAYATLLRTTQIQKEIEELGYLPNNKIK